MQMLMSWVGEGPFTYIHVRGVTSMCTKDLPILSITLNKAEIKKPNRTLPWGSLPWAIHPLNTPGPHNYPASLSSSSLSLQLRSPDRAVVRLRLCQSMMLCDVKVLLCAL